MVTGSTGFVGSAVCNEARSHNLEVIGVARTETGDGVALDVTDQPRLLRALDRISPAVVLHFAAAARPVDVERQRDFAFSVNVGATKLIADWCRANRRLFVMASSDWVFDGESGPYDELAPARPRTIYGRMKREGEAAALAADGLVVRLGWVLNDTSLTKLDFVQRSLMALATGAEVVAAYDEHRTPVLSSCAARAVVLLTLRGERGVIHVAGPEHTTAHDLLSQRAEAAGFAKGQVVRISRKQLAPAGRPRDVRLDTARLCGRLGDFANDCSAMALFDAP
ncbi:MAG: SDR family oxidoreductase [Caulobacteraceae bacterium]